MKHGDLSNDVVPRLLLVYEGALGFLPGARVAEYNSFGSRGQWDRAARCWDLNSLCMQKIVDLVVRKNFQLELVTFVGPDDFAVALADRLDEESLPISRVTASTPERTARRLSYAPDVAAVYDSDPAHAWVYGGKGRVLRSVHELGR